MAVECWDALGICIEKRIDFGNLFVVILGFIGLFSIFLAYRQLRIGQRAQQTQIAIHLHSDFFEEPDLRDFLYRLDYSDGPKAWKFNPKTFPHSEDERLLDLILYKFSFIGSLVENNDIKIGDLLWLKVEAKIVLENEDVIKYLEWIQSSSQIPGHSSFSGAIKLYNSLVGGNGESHKRLNRYLQHAKK